ncbi:hypothetical protein [Celerinatantimonas sp. YJH-8]|uniref:hypothetical protein n=1 Tax=Celerinatantimonas sp. YJH-8 TaxID=3228714 RepID=UPI0038C3D8AA
MRKMTITRNGREYRLVKINGKIKEVDVEAINTALSSAMEVRRKQLEEREREFLADGITTKV